MHCSTQPYSNLSALIYAHKQKKTTELHGYLLPEKLKDSWCYFHAYNQSSSLGVSIREGKACPAVRRSSRSGPLCGGQQRRIEELCPGDVVDAAAGSAGLGIRDERGGVCDVRVANKVHLSIKLDERGAHAAMTVTCPGT